MRKGLLFLVSMFLGLMLGTAMSAFTTRSSNTEIAELQARIEKLESVVKISSSGVSIETPGSLKLQGGGSVSLKGGSAVELEGGGSLKLKGSALDVESQSTLNLKGAAIKMNNGSKRVAYEGSAVNGDKVVNGSPTILVP